jgi:hypothetical protein
LTDEGDSDELLAELVRSGFEPVLRPLDESEA